MFPDADELSPLFFRIKCKCGKVIGLNSRTSTKRIPPTRVACDYQTFSKI